MGMLGVLLKEAAGGLGEVLGEIAGACVGGRGSNFPIM